MLKNDAWIRSTPGLITPLVPQLERHIGVIPALSYGCSSYGYDLRLSPKDFKIFRHVPGTVMDPKRFNPQNLEQVKLHADTEGMWFVLPAHSYGLGVALERLQMPGNVTAIF